MRNKEHDAIRIPPHSNSAEQSVLGSVLLAPDSYYQVELRPTDFYRFDHSCIWEAIADCDRSGARPDAMTVGHQLQKNGTLDDVGGAGYLIELANNTPTAQNIVAYADIVKDNARLREIIKICDDSATLCYRGNEDSEKILDDAQRKLTALTQSTGKSKIVSMDELVKTNYGVLERRYEDPDSVRVFSTGFPDLDAVLGGGPRPGELIIVAARPSMGKSTFARQVSLNMCAGAFKKEPGKHGTGVFMSLEDTAPAFADRCFSAASSIPLSRIKNPQHFGDEDWTKLEHGMRRLRSVKLSVDDDTIVTQERVKAVARRQHARDGDSFVCLTVDYLQLMETADLSYGKSLSDAIGEITRSLKLLGKELDIPVIVLSQLTRKVEERPNKRPVLSDLRSSGSIEQDADVVIFLYRDEVYNPESKHKGICEVMVAKNKNGEKGSIYLKDELHYARFATRSPEDYAPNQ